MRILFPELSKKILVFIANELQCAKVIIVADKVSAPITGTDYRNSGNGVVK